MFDNTKAEFPIFNIEPTPNNLEHFLEKTNNPNIIQKGCPLFVNFCERVSDDETMLKCLKIFSKYECNFTKLYEKKCGLQIVYERLFLKSIDYLIKNKQVLKEQD